MSSTKDVDDAIIEQARSLLPYFRGNTTHDISIKSLSEVPWFLVLVFELLTTETIPLEMKPFSSLQEQARTLQMILDTLEQTLRLPMNHITGEGLARLERRHLSDVLQIFSDLVKHCFPARSTLQTVRDGGKCQHVTDTPESRGLSLSQFDSPDFGMVSFIQSRTPELSTLSVKRGLHLQEQLAQSNVIAQKQLGRSSRASPVVPVIPVPKTGMSQASNTVQKVPCSRYVNAGESTVQQQLENCAPVAHMEGGDGLPSLSQSSMTLLKEVYRKHARGDDKNHDRIDVVKERRQMRNEFTPQTHSVFERRLPSLALLSPVKSEQKVKRLHSKPQINHKNKIMSPFKTSSYRYKPYEQLGRPCDVIHSSSKTLDDIPLQRRLSSARVTKNMTQLQQTRVKRRPSAARALCRKPSVKSFQSPTTSLSRRTGMLQKENQCSSSKPKMDTVSLSKSTSETKCNVGSNKETVCRSRKQSTVKSAYQPHVKGVVKKPPQLLSRKTSSKNTYERQVTRSRVETAMTSVSNRRQETDDSVYKHQKNENNKQERISSRSLTKHCNHSSVSKETSSFSRRRASVVSTKVRKHSTTSSRSPMHGYGRNSKFRQPVKRGEVSPQTTSLCSSLKLLEEFDFVKRRLKEIKVQKREYMEAIDELEREEVRLEYLLSHVQQQSARALIKDPSERLPTLGAAV